MSSQLFSMAGLSEAEIFTSFCSQEHAYGSGCTNLDCYFVPAGVPMEEEAFYDMMDRLGEQALASEAPIAQLQRFQVYLARCADQIGDVIEAATQHRAMSREIVMLVNRKQRVRVPAGLSNSSEV